jgi:ABC-type bacteriocin/lantibiotic exporter with double-glycine peptidase domain
MGKIDEVKEILNTLRVSMSIGFGVFVLIIGKVISFYVDNNFSELFWMSIIAAILNIIVIFLIVKKIALKTKEIKDL